MSPKDCAYIVERLAIRFMALVAEHERQLSEHRTSFGARTEADAKIIARLQSENVAARMAGLERDSLMSERNGLLTQVQDMRAEMQRLSAQLDWERAEIKRLQWENLTMHKDAEDGYAEAIKVLGDPIALSKERDALRAEVAALQERLRASITRGDFAQMEVAALKSQNPKQHGRWVRATSEKCMHGEPTIGDTVRLVKIPTIGAVSPELQKALEWPWIERWGTLNQTALVVEPAYQLEGALSVCLRTNVHVRWPVCCIEVVSEANHDTEAGKAVAESAVSDPVTEEIKVGDLGEVFQATTRTLNSDVGITGCVSSIHLDPCHGGFLVKFDPSTQSRRSAGMQAFGLCDVRKVPT